MITQSGMTGQVYGMSQRMTEVISPKITRDRTSLKSDLSFLFLETSLVSQSRTRNIIKASPIHKRLEKPESPPRARARMPFSLSSSVAVEEADSVSLESVTKAPLPAEPATAKVAVLVSVGMVKVCSTLTVGGEARETTRYT